MSKIAIDIVLLPDKEMTDKAIELSVKQSKNYNDKILLNEKNCLPHISLVMGAINEEDIQEISDLLEKNCAQLKFFNLVADSYRSPTIPSGEIVSEFSIKKEKNLQELHEMIMKKLAPFISYDVVADVLYAPPPVEEISLYWIKNYKNSSFDNFRPHLTIGFGEEKNKITPISFTASTIALCQLGNYCTCRKVLYSVKLKK